MCKEGYREQNRELGSKVVHWEKYKNQYDRGHIRNGTEVYQQVHTRGEGIKEGLPTIQGHMRNGATRRSTGAHSHIPCGGGSVCCSATMRGDRRNKKPHIK